jgi:predicted dehydrogenase
VSKRVGLASIGLGWWGKALAEAVDKGGAGQIVSCFARGEEGRNAFAEQFGCRAAGSLDELLADDEVKGVLIATSHQSHLGLIEKAAAAGKAIFIEKPLTTTVDEGRQAIAAAKIAGVPLQVGHQRRRTAANRRIKQMIEAGELGDLEAVETNHSVPNGHFMPEQAWRWNPDESPLGGMTSLGVHKVDTMAYLMGPIKSVFTFTRPGRTKTIDEATVLALEFESGALGTLVTSFFVPTISEVRVFGTDYSAFNVGDGTKLFTQKRGELAREEIELTPVDPIVDQLVEFAKVAAGEMQPEADGEVGLNVVAAMAAAVESSLTRRAVDIADHL